MKKIIEWLYWEGIRKFTIASFITMFGGIILINIERTETLGAVVLISWLILGIIYLIFANWYEKKYQKDIDIDEDV
jgi:hypothetical protein